jgi:hypothetical protein
MQKEPRGCCPGRFQRQSSPSGECCNGYGTRGPLVSEMAMFRQLTSRCDIPDLTVVNSDFGSPPSARAGNNKARSKQHTERLAQGGRNRPAPRNRDAELVQASRLDGMLAPA